MFILEHLIWECAALVQDAAYSTMAAIDTSEGGYGEESGRRVFLLGMGMGRVSKSDWYVWFEGWRVRCEDVWRVSTMEKV
jgi:hypothetical protein